MASERFLKLDKEKRERILSAAREEFSSVPYEDASINKIIKNAGISRGSFYTYFDDKEDLLSYIYGEMNRDMERSLRDSLLREKGNIWSAVLCWTEEILGYMGSPTVWQFIRITVNTGLLFQAELRSRWGEEKRSTDEEQLKWILLNTDDSVLDKSRPMEELRTLYQMVLQFALVAFAAALTTNLKKEQILSELRLRMDILRRGININLKKTS